MPGKSGTAISRSLLLALLMLIPGALGWAANQPWLFPSLGPSSCIHVASPRLPSARLYNTFLGHVIAASSGFLMVWLTGADGAPSWLGGGPFLFSRALASSSAVGLTLALQILFKAHHAPAASTALLISLGGFSLTLRDAGILLIGVTVITIAGEASRRLILRRESAHEWN